MSDDEGQSTEAATSPIGTVTDQVDVRRASTGLLLYNLILCTNSLQQNTAVLMQMREAWKQQGLVGSPPQLAQLEHTVAEQTRARDIMVRNLEDRFRGVDEIYWARLGIAFTPAEQERA